VKSFAKQLIQIARFPRVPVVIVALTAFSVIPAQRALADHSIPPYGPDVPPMSESYRDEAQEFGPTGDAEIINHPIGGSGSHAVFAKTVLRNPSSAPIQAVCTLRTTSGNFDTVTATIPPSWTERGVRSDGSVAVSLQAIDLDMPAIHFGLLTCRSGGAQFGATASMSKVWAVAVFNCDYPSFIPTAPNLCT
jgi:hypothetical protein